MRRVRAGASSPSGVVNASGGDLAQTTRDNASPPDPVTPPPRRFAMLPPVYSLLSALTATAKPSGSVAADELEATAKVPQPSLSASASVPAPAPAVDAFVALSATIAERDAEIASLLERLSASGSAVAAVVHEVAAEVQEVAAEVLDVAAEVLKVAAEVVQTEPVPEAAPADSAANLDATASAAESATLDSSTVRALAPEPTFKDRVSAFLPVAGAIAAVGALFVTLIAAIVVTGGSVVPATMASSLTLTGGNLIALSMRADEAAAVIPSSAYITYGFKYAFDSFTFARLQSASFAWLTTFAAVIITLYAIAEARNLLALLAAIAIVVFRGVKYVALELLQAPARATRYVQRNIRGLVIFFIVSIVSVLVSGADAAAVSKTLSNVCSSAQALSLENFAGETACRISDHRQSLGLPLYIPPALCDSDACELASSLGICAFNANVNSSAVRSSGSGAKVSNRLSTYSILGLVRLACMASVRTSLPAHASSTPPQYTQQMVL